MCNNCRSAARVEYRRNDNCYDGRQRLAMINFPIQHADWDRVYPPERALCEGTIFPELNLPYMGRGGEKR